MSKMRIFALLLTLCMVLSVFAACDWPEEETTGEETASKTETGDTSNTENEVTTTETETETETTETETETTETETETTETETETTETETETTETETETTETETETDSEEETDPPHTHDFGEWKTTKAATCAEQGKQERECSCGEKQTKELDALGHNEVNNAAKAPTCTEIGWDAYVTCSRCNYSTYAEKNALGHDEVNHAAKAPTCTEIGWDAYVTCSRCEYTTYKAKSELGHKPGANATCTEPQNCTVCGEKLTAENGHIPGKSATCTDSQTCAICGEVIKAALGHDEQNHDAKAPTCTEIGWDAYVTCSRCDYTTYNEKAKLGHDEVNHAAKAPTCTDNGWDAYVTCSRCNYTTYSEKNALGHDYQSVVIAPTAKEDGYTKHTCTNCGDFYTDTFVKPVDFEVTSGNRDQIGYKGTEGENLVIPAVFQKDGTWYRVTSIGDSAFHDCTSLASVVIPDSVTSIGEYAFQNCTSLESVVIGDSVTSIGDWAFYNCTNLTSIAIPASVISIGGNAFYYCTRLKSIVVDSNNENYQSNEGNLYSKNGKILIQYAIGKNATSFTIPDGVTSIGDYAFSGCTSLTSIEIGDNVTSIGNSAFSGCTNLANIEIPDGITSIGDYTFYFCRSLKSITIPDSVASIGDKAFYNCTSLETVYYAGSAEDWAKISIGSNNEKLTNANIIYGRDDEGGNGCNHDYEASVTAPTAKDDGYAEYICSKCGDSYTEIIIPVDFTVTYSNRDQVGYKGTWGENLVIPAVFEKDGTWYRVTSIEDSAFAGCPSLKNVEIPDSVISIGVDAFSCCGSLKSVTFGDGSKLASIGDGAFCQSSLEDIEIPYGVTSIGDNAFHCCPSLTAITVNENNEHYMSIDGNLYSKDGNTLIQYAIGKTDTSFTVPDGVIRINAYAFNSCEFLESITVSNSVTSVGDYAFFECMSLANVIFGNNSRLASIGDGAFYGCTSLESIEIGDSVTSIGDSAFYGCTSLKSVEIGDSVTSIGNSAFLDCTSLETVYYAGSSEDWAKISIGWGNIELTNANIIYGGDDEGGSGCNHDYEAFVTAPTAKGDGYIEYVCLNCFDFYAETIKPVSFTVTDENRDQIGYKGTVGEHLVIPAVFEKDGTWYRVTSIADGAFMDCYDLKSVEISEGIKTIGYEAFSYCSSLTSIVIPTSITKIGDYAFNGCSDLKNVSYNGSKEDWNNILIGSENKSLTNATITYGRDDDEDDDWSTPILPF